MSRPADALGSPGAYALILRCDTTQRVPIGRLGEMLVVPGYYVYVGSALGPGGLAGRVQRHLSGTGKVHWHIDYLRQVAEIIDIWQTVGPTRHEHVWSGLFARMAGASVPMPGFGASDCNCLAHLLRFADAPSLTIFAQALAAAVPGATCCHWPPPALPERAKETLQTYDGMGASADSGRRRVIDGCQTDCNAHLAAASQCGTLHPE